MRSIIHIFSILSLFFGGAVMASEPKTIKTYMSFGVPVDPANVKTLVDLDLSYALAATLVDWTDSRTLKQGLARAVDGASGDKQEKIISFQLRPEAKWSDGSKISADQVVRSFNRAKKLHGEDLKSLFEMVETIEAKGESTIEFKLNRPVAKSQIHHKLTEPMYGVVYLKADGQADLTKSSGPFGLSSESKEELTLVANPHWFGRETGMADKIVIRQPKTKATMDQDDFAGDSWPNIVASTSLMPKEISSRYEKEHFSIWNRNLDRVFFLSPGPKLASMEGRSFFQTLNQKLDRDLLTKGLSGFRLNQQFFPPGYAIYDSEFNLAPKKAEVPSQLTKQPLEFLGAEGRLSAVLQANISHAVKQLTGHAPKFNLVPLAKFNEARAEGKYDILVASLPVNDPNVEGAVSFYFGMTPPLIPNSGEGSGDFKKRTTEARSQEETKRNAEYRRVFTQAVNDGCLLPLFHFSSIVIARDGIDLSRVPTSDETVAFSKVRFK